MSCSTSTKWFLGFALLMVSSWCLAEAVGDIVAGEKKAIQACQACHGKGGDSASPINPKLAGQHSSYIIKQLNDFKSGKRVGSGAGAIMNGLAKGLSDQEILNLAAYFSSQKVSLGKVENASVALGRKVYEGGNPKSGVPACIGCHSPTGSGNAPAKFPRLSGQHAGYTESQLKAFREAARAEDTARSLDRTLKTIPGRSNDTNRMMRIIVLRMSDDEIKAVAEYITGLHAKQPMASNTSASDK